MADNGRTFGKRCFILVVLWWKKFADWRVADWNSKEICGFAICGSTINNCAFEALHLAGWHSYEIFGFVIADWAKEFADEIFGFVIAYWAQEFSDEIFGFVKFSDLWNFRIRTEPKNLRICMPTFALNHYLHCKKGYMLQAIVTIFWHIPGLKHNDVEKVFCLLLVCSKCRAYS